METRIQRIFLNTLLLSLTTTLSSVVIAAEETRGNEPDKPYEPQVERRSIDVDAIDTENFDIGFNYGVITIEDFGSSEMMGLRFNYHVTEDFFLQVAAGEAEAGETSWEVLNPGASLLTENGRQYTYYALNFGWNMLPGETFITDNLSFNSAFYLLLGAGNTEFADDKRFTINFGAGYRFVLLDWLTAYIEAQNHLLEIDVIGKNKRTNNPEFSLGFSAYF